MTRDGSLSSVRSSPLAVSTRTPRAINARVASSCVTSSTRQARGILDDDDPNAVAFDAVEQVCKAFTALDRISAEHRNVGELVHQSQSGSLRKGRDCTRWRTWLSPSALVAYLRTSSATNADGDSQVRQRAAIAAFSKTAGFELVDEFADVAVSGADPIESREGFAHLLDRIEGNGVRIVIIEDASRLARQLVTQELAILALIARGVRVLTANGDDLTDDSDPSRVMMRQIAGAFHQYEKARLVAKLKAARDRKRATGARAEGRLSHAEKRPEVVMLAKKLRRKLPKGGQKSYSEIAAELFALGHANSNGVAFSKSSIKSMLEG